MDTPLTLNHLMRIHTSLTACISFLQEASRDVTDDQPYVERIGHLIETRGIIGGLAKEAETNGDTWTEAPTFDNYFCADGSEPKAKT